MTCYLELGNSRKRERLLAHVIDRGEPGLVSSALQRQAAMLADAGAIDEAWAVFERAQRADPDSLSLIGLELTLLASMREFDRARERATFWLRSLERSADPELVPLMEFVRAVRDDPKAALSQVEFAHMPEVAQLDGLISRAPAPQASYRIERTGEGGVLEPLPACAELEQRWVEIVPESKPPLTATQTYDDAMWDEPRAWLDFLDSEPFAWQSFGILDDLVLAVDALDPGFSSESVLDRLLARAAELLRVNLDQSSGGERTLPWGWFENRPALRLLAHGIFRELSDPGRSASSDSFIERARAVARAQPE